MKTIALILVAASIGFSTSAFALTDEECATMWKNADANNDGVVSGSEADRYAASVRAAGRTVPAQWNRVTFVENCKAGILKAADAGDVPPLKGANSFTENQAKSRIAKAGFTNVLRLTKDDNGIWRGIASKDGKSVNVALDYKGNVVAN